MHTVVHYTRFINVEEGVLIQASSLPVCRYKELVEDEDHERLTRVLTALEKKDEMQQRMEAITKSVLLPCNKRNVNTCSASSACLVLQVYQHSRHSLLFVWQHAMALHCTAFLLETLPEVQQLLPPSTCWSLGRAILGLPPSFVQAASLIPFVLDRQNSCDLCC